MSTFEEFNKEGLKIDQIGISFQAVLPSYIALYLSFKKWYSIVLQILHSSMIISY